jgi:hypothetical protein
MCQALLKRGASFYFVTLGLMNKKVIIAKPGFIQYLKEQIAANKERHKKFLAQVKNQKLWNQ